MTKKRTLAQLCIPLAASIMLQSCYTLKNTSYETIEYYPETKALTGTTYSYEQHNKITPESPNITGTVKERSAYRIKKKVKEIKHYEYDTKSATSIAILGGIGSIVSLAVLGQTIESEDNPDPLELTKSQKQGWGLTLGISAITCLIGWALSTNHDSKEKSSIIDKYETIYEDRNYTKPASIFVTNKNIKKSFPVQPDGSFSFSLPYDLGFKDIEVPNFKSFNTSISLELSLQTLNKQHSLSTYYASYNDFLYPKVKILDNDVFAYEQGGTSDTLITIKKGTTFDLIAHDESRYIIRLPNGQKAYEYQKRAKGLYVSGYEKNILNTSKIAYNHPPLLKISNINFKDSNNNAFLEANENATISFTVNNIGEGKAYLTNVKTQASNTYKGLSVPSSTLIGNIEAHDSIKVELPVNGSIKLEEGRALIDLTVKEISGFDSSPIRVSIPTKAFKSPQLDLQDYDFISYKDKTIKKMAPVSLKCIIRNNGEGEAKYVKVSLALPENVFSAADTLIEIDHLPAQTDKEVSFDFFANKRFSEDSIKVSLNVSEQYNVYSTIQNRTLSVPISQDNTAFDEVVIQGRTPSVQVSTLTTETVDYEIPQLKSVDENAIAVIIGNRRYKHNDIPNVKYAQNDAQIMKKYLVEGLRFKEGNIIYVEDATQADFNSIFGTKHYQQAKLFNMIKEGKSDVFIYYSGHGAPDVSNKTAYFVPTDCDPSLIQVGGYSLDTFYENLSTLPYRSINVIIDACFGGISEGGTLMLETSPVIIKPKAKILNNPNASIFTSSQFDQVSSWYTDKRHSMFTYFYLKALQGEADTNKDKQISIQELSDYLVENVSYTARKLKNRRQIPYCKGKSEKVVFSFE